MRQKPWESHEVPAAADPNRWHDEPLKSEHSSEAPYCLRERLLSPGVRGPPVDRPQRLLRQAHLPQCAPGTEIERPRELDIERRLYSWECARNARPVVLGGRANLLVSDVVSRAGVEGRESGRVPAPAPSGGASSADCILGTRVLEPHHAIDRAREGERQSALYQGLQRISKRTFKLVRTQASHVITGTRTTRCRAASSPPRCARFRKGTRHAG